MDAVLNSAVVRKTADRARQHGLAAQDAESQLRIVPDDDRSGPLRARRKAYLKKMLQGGYHRIPRFSNSSPDFDVVKSNQYVRFVYRHICHDGVLILTYRYRVLACIVCSTLCMCAGSIYFTLS